ncbi:hypothetical protein DQ04_07921020 [Trypanosoma grayi]|uniref:hypothetical protein n=1 Tax=Trypanosoma grayi TaxID=71804 RepID=UPI0004F4A92B|nr:hypothetical protein DQ04_07921020 [Trypanosoma grayi]KEG08139.1 hypothetical protein DQ04_07921020 [Trypanosoma grayi]
MFPYSPISSGVAVEKERDVRRRLVSFYEKHNPRQLGHIDTILFAYKDHWDDLFAALAVKYEGTGTQPAVLSAFQFTTNDGSYWDTCYRETSDSNRLVSSFTLLDPVEVVQGRRRRRDGCRENDPQCNSTAARCRGGNNGIAPLALPRRSRTIDEEERDTRRLKLQQLVMHFAPNRVLDMEEIMAQYREAYKAKVRRRDRSDNSVTEAEWQDVMICDFLHEFDKSKNGTTDSGAMVRPDSEEHAPKTYFPFSGGDAIGVAESPFDRQQMQTINAVVSETPLGMKMMMPSPLQPRKSALYDDDSGIHSHLKPLMDDEWCAPLGDESICEAAERPWTPVSNMTTDAHDGGDAPEPQPLSRTPGGVDSAPEERTDATSKPFVVLRRQAFSKPFFVPFLQTHGEQRAERFLAHLSVKRAMDCPYFHYRLFLLLCSALRRVEGGGIMGSTGVDVLARRESTIPYWEPSLRCCVLWRTASPRTGQASFLMDEDVADALPRDLVEKLHVTWTICRACGLESLWCNEVTLADVVALRMRYFARRQDVVKRILLRPFTAVFNFAVRVDDDSDWGGRQCRRDDDFEFLCFIGTVAELNQTFYDYNEERWIEFIQLWYSEHNLHLEMAALEVELSSQTELSDVVGPHFEEVRVQNAEQKEGCSKTGVVSTKKRLPLGADALLTCTAMLCVHMDQPFSGVTYLDVAATHYCLCVAAISAKEDCERRGVIEAWRKVHIELQYLAGQSSMQVSLQDRESCQREALEMQESSMWMKLIQSFVPVETVKGGGFCKPVGSPSSLLLYLGNHPEPLVFLNSQGERRSVVNASKPLLVPHWRRGVAQRRLAAFFEREAERQRHLKERLQVEQIASMLRVGKLSL